MFEARNLKFGTQIDRDVPYRENQNLGRKGSPGGHVTILGNFGTPSVSPQRLKLEIRNLACRMIVRYPIVKNDNLGEKGSPGGHVTILGNFGTPSISQQRLKLEIRKLACRMTVRCPMVKTENLGEKRHQGVT